ncbi:MAG TPA: hypothetical protein PL134_04570 [Smithellaceae bacterium]|jgi:hypothetical protein|nr:hypothetical protein [Smithellaceae bacterium]HPM70395.1 hypothetical protein [Smithellaceae bacterium]
MAEPKVLFSLSSELCKYLLSDPTSFIFSSSQKPQNKPELLNFLAIASQNVGIVKSSM